MAASAALLGEEDPPAFETLNEDGSSLLLIVGDHAGCAIPRRLGNLGLPPEELRRHIGLDIGVAGLGERLAVRLDACFIRQTYSRLVIDCNRKLGAAGSIPEVSDGTVIPPNQGLGQTEVAARQTEVFNAYHGEIARVLDARLAAGKPTLFVALHSFTPVFQGYARPWRYGVLHRQDSALSSRVLSLLRQGFGDAVGDNQPYELGEIDNTVPMHADARGLNYLELEVRQDLIADEDGQAAQAEMLAGILYQAIP